MTKSVSRRIRLFEIDGEYNNHQFNIKMTYYLRAKNIEIIEQCFAECKNIVGSMYFGFTVHVIKEIKLTNISKVKTIKVNLK